MWLSGHFVLNDWYILSVKEFTHYQLKCWLSRFYFLPLGFHLDMYSTFSLFLQYALNILIFSTSLPFWLYSQEYLWFFNSPLSSIVLIPYPSVSKLWYNLFYIIRVFISRVLTCFFFLCAMSILIDYSFILLSNLSNFSVFLNTLLLIHIQILLYTDFKCLFMNLLLFCFVA